MLDTDTLNSPELQKYLESYRSGDILFLEGDDSKDIYVLVSGRLEVLKDDKILFEITKPGALVGEMSYLLDSRRTATVKATDTVQIIRVPGDQVEDFLTEFPCLAPQITRGLAQRLKETTKVMHGFREFCDQLPDAVIMTDRDRKILAWNQAAEKLHGRAWQQMKGQPLAEVYRDPEEYQEFIEEIRASHSLKERVLEIKHPDRDENYFVSTSTTVLYDAHHNVEGYLFLSRDVTNLKNLEKSYNRIKKWLIPAAVAFGLLVLALFFAIPHFSKGVRILDHKKQTFRDKIHADYQALTAAVSGPLHRGDSQAVDRVLRQYFESKDNPSFYGINGLVLLDAEKKVSHAYSPIADSAALLGTSYSGLSFKGDEEHQHRVLSLFRADRKNPMGFKGVEIAFTISGPAAQAGWLLFQMDMEELGREYGLDEKTLLKINFSNDR